MTTTEELLALKLERQKLEDDIVLNETFSQKLLALTRSALLTDPTIELIRSMNLLHMDYMPIWSSSNDDFKGLELMHLVSIIYANAHVSGVFDLSGLYNIHTLNLAGNANMTSVRNLHVCKKLQTIDLDSASGVSSAEFEIILTDLLSIANTPGSVLTYINLSECYNVTGMSSNPKVVLLKAIPGLTVNIQV